MKQSTKNTLVKTYRHFLSFFVPAFLIFIVWYKMGIYYSTNDDRCLTEMLAGLVTLENESHLIYINYLLAAPLSLLYKITTSIPWFGICLILLYYLSYVFIFKAVYSRTKNILQDFIMTIVISCFFLAHIYLLGQITYTAIATFVATAGYFALLLHTNKKCGLIYFILLESLAFMLRDQAMLMIQPLGLAVVCTYIIISDFSAFKKNIIKCLQILGIIASIIIVLFLGNKLGYMGENWKIYTDFNESRTVLCDYTDFPPYEDVKNILDKYDVSKATYEGFISYTILDWDINTDCLRELADYAQTQYDPPVTIADAFEKYTSILFKETKDYYHINKLLITMFIISVIYILLSGSIKSFIPLSGLLFSQGIVWIYLLYRGRYPDRVTIPLLASETLFLIAIIFITYTKGKSRKYISVIRLAVLLISIVLFCKTSYTCYQLQHKDAKIQNTTQNIFIQGLTDITDYCNSFPDNKYIVETISLRWYYGNALQTDIFEPRNYTYAGGWFSNTPCFIEKNIDYFDDTSGGFHFIICTDDVDDVLKHPSVIYLAEKSSSVPILSDQFKASHGGTYSVIYFDGELKLNTNP